jgi:hypothetical protein
MSCIDAYLSAGLRHAPREWQYQVGTGCIHCTLRWAHNARVLLLGLPACCSKVAAPVCSQAVSQGRVGRRSAQLHSLRC